MSPLPFLLLGALAGAWIVYRFRDAGPLEATAAVGVGSLMAAPYALPYDLAVVAPLLVCAVFRGKVLAALGLSGIFAPLPLIISTIELFRGKSHGRMARMENIPDLAESGHAPDGGDLHDLRPLV